MTISQEYAALPLVTRIGMQQSVSRELGLSREQLDVLSREGIDLAALGLAVFDVVVTEETTDAALDFLSSTVKLPVYVRWIPGIARRVLDSMLPEGLRALVVHLFRGE